MTKVPAALRSFRCWRGRAGRRAWAPLVVAAALGAGLPAQAQDYRLLRLDGVHLKWGVPQLGTGAEVTYGYAVAERSFPDAINCRDLAPLAALAPVWQADPARLTRLVAGAFAIWSRAADLSFRPAAPGEDPDILIGAQATPSRIAFANVWHGAAPAGQDLAPLTGATICFNPELAWFAGDGPVPAGGLDFATVLAHEIGHALGLDHPGATGALMGYRNQGDIDQLMPGDIAGAVALYGPAR